MAAVPQPLSKKAGKFLVVGASATALQYVLLIVFVEWLSMKPIIASALSYGLSTLFNYRLNYSFTFQSNVRHQTAFARFITVAAIGLALNTLLFGLVHEVIGWHYLLAQVVATGLVLVWNFLANNYWSFGK